VEIARENMVSSLRKMRRAQEYSLYIGENEKYIIGDSPSDDSGSADKATGYSYPDLLMDALALAESFPPVSYMYWDEADKDRGDTEALEFYNRYGHMHFENMDFKTSGPAYTPCLDMPDDFFHPLGGSDDELHYRHMVGEPVWMFYDAVWYIGRLANFWHRFKAVKPELDAAYTPSRLDNIQRLLNRFNFAGYASEIDEADLKKGMDIGTRAGRQYTWPTWGEMTRYFGNSLQTSVSFGLDAQGNPQIVYNAASLFEILCLFVMFDIDCDKGRRFRFCKNCHELFFTDNPHAEYCSTECRGRYNTQMWRLRKAEKEA